MKKLSFIALTILFLTACKSTQPLSKQETTQATGNTQKSTKVVFSLEKTACYGTCPVFKMTIFENDSLVFEGERFVGSLGIHSQKIATGTVEQLKATFREAHFFNFQKEYRANISDLPTTYIAFYDKSQALKITDYHGSPESLKKLEQLLIDLVADKVNSQK